LVTLGGPRTQSVLYLHDSHSEASPKAISGRTSYLQVRLEFLRYPHVIPELFNARGFGPPVRVTAPSPCTGVDHLVSGLRPRTPSNPQDCSYGSLCCALFRLAFAAASASHLNLARERNSPVHSTKGTPSPLDRALTSCKRTVSGSISLPFRGAFHLSLTVLLRYRSPGSI
jgi:hypothetical protein